MCPGHAAENLFRIRCEQYLRYVLSVPPVAFVTPAVVEITLFFVTLIFFLATQINFRRYVASFFTTREGKLRYIRIANDIEEHLATYITTVTIINFGLGVVVAIGAWLFGLPNPIILGLMDMALNYVPYIGAAAFYHHSQRRRQ